MAMVNLPDPAPKGAVTLEESLGARRSVRAYSDAPLTLAQLSQLLWAAQGVTDKERGGRAAPSAGALYPLEIVVAAGHVEGLEPGIYRYRPAWHALERAAAGDRRGELAAAALGQDWMADAPVIVGIAGVYERTTRKYGQRGERYVHMETGHAAQNLCLQAQALGLAACMVGAFADGAVQQVLQLASSEKPLALLPVGRAAR